METLIDNGISQLYSIIYLLKELKKNKDSLDNCSKMSQKNMNIKTICFKNNIDILKDSVLCMLSDLDKNTCVISKETEELIIESKKMSKVIDELLPYLMYYYFNRKESSDQGVPLDLLHLLDQ